MGIRTALSLGILACFLALGGPAGAESTPQENFPIDLWLEEALAADASTAGMVEAYAEGTKRWDKELNVQYQLLGQKLRPEALQALRASQRLWIKYRNAEIAAAQALGRELSEINGGGTIWSVITAERVLHLTRTRTLELQAYVRYLTGSPEGP